MECEVGLVGGSRERKAPQGPGGEIGSSLSTAARDVTYRPPGLRDEALLLGECGVGRRRPEQVDRRSAARPHAADAADVGRREQNARAERRRQRAAGQRPRARWRRQDHHDGGGYVARSLG